MEIAAFAVFVAVCFLVIATRDATKSNEAVEQCASGHRQEGLRISKEEANQFFSIMSSCYAESFLELKRKHECKFQSRDDLLATAGLIVLAVMKKTTASAVMQTTIAQSISKSKPSLQDDKEAVNQFLVLLFFCQLQSDVSDMPVELVLMAITNSVGLISENVDKAFEAHKAKDERGSLAEVVDSFMESRERSDIQSYLDEYFDYEFSRSVDSAALESAFSKIRSLGLDR